MNSKVKLVVGLIVIVILVWISIEVILFAYGMGLYMGLEHSDWKGVAAVDRMSQGALMIYMEMTGRSSSNEMLEKRWKEEIFKTPFKYQIKMMLFIWPYIR